MPQADRPLVVRRRSIGRRPLNRFRRVLAIREHLKKFVYLGADFNRDRLCLFFLHHSPALSSASNRHPTEPKASAIAKPPLKVDPNSLLSLCSRFVVRSGSLLRQLLPGAPRNRQFLELLPIAEFVSVVTEIWQDGKDRYHVLCNFRIHIPQIGQIKAAMLASVPPSQEKMCRSPALSGVALRHLKQPFNRALQLLKFGLSIWSCRCARKYSMVVWKGPFRIGIPGSRPEVQQKAA